MRFCLYGRCSRGDGRRQELYGTDRDDRALNRKPDVSRKELLELVHRDVDSFVGEAPQFDGYYNAVSFNTEACRFRRRWDSVNVGLSYPNSIRHRGRAK